MFVNEYHKTLKLRADVDMIGHNLREHYEYFADRCQHTLTAKEVLELHNYLSRRRKLAASSCPSANNNDPNSREWVQLILNYLAGVNSGGVVIDERYIAATAAI